MLKIQLNNSNHRRIEFTEKSSQSLFFVLLRFILFVFPAFYFIGLFLNIEFIIQSGIAYYILFLFTLIIDFICIYKSSLFKIRKIVLILLYLCITYCLIMIIFLLIGEVSL